MTFASWHTPQVSREEMEEESVRQGFIKAFEDGNDGLVIHLADEYPEFDMMSHCFQNGENCLMMAVSHHNDKLVVFCLEEGIDVECVSMFQSPMSIRCPLPIR